MAWELGCLGGRRSHREGVVDSTGLESEHASRYFRWRKSEEQPKRGLSSWPKLTVLCHRQTQLVLASHVCLGPTQDSHLLRTVLRKSEPLVHCYRILADAGYDAEKNHVFCREFLGIPQTVIPIKGNLCRRGVACNGKYRRQMRYRFPKRYYGQRWQVESYFSRFKRRLGAQIQARKWLAQVRECYLRVITLNFLILLQLAQCA